jgi:uncharacterized membrane protein
MIMEPQAGATVRAGGEPAAAGVRVLIAGESWVTHGLHAKGAVTYSTASYEEGGEPLLAALRGGGADVTYLPNHLAGEHFPREAGGLAEYDVVLLSDIGSDTLLLDRACFLEGRTGVNRLQSLARYVEQGGGLLMVGGYMSFSGIEGRAHYGMTPLAEVLPVHILPYDDRIEAPQGVQPASAGSADHPVLAGLPGPWPRLLGYNRLGVKAGADVLLTFGDDPCLIVQNVGHGRAAAFASDCSPHWGGAEFLAWPGYAQFWMQLVGWLARRRQLLRPAGTGRAGRARQHRLDQKDD